MTGTWREYKDLVKPEIVVWFYFEGNDLLNISEEKNTLLRKYLDPAYSQNLLHRDEERMAELATLLEKTARQYKTTKPLHGDNATSNQRPFLFNLLTLYHIREYFGVTSRGINLKAYEQTFSNFTRRHVEKPKVLFVYCPASTLSALMVSDRYFRAVMRTIGVTLLTWLSVRASRSLISRRCCSTKMIRRVFPFRRYNHYGPAAYTLLAKEISAVIKQM